MMDFMKMIIRMDTEFLNGEMEINIQVILKMIKDKEQDK